MVTGWSYFVESRGVPGSCISCTRAFPLEVTRSVISNLALSTSGAGGVAFTEPRQVPARVFSWSNDLCASDTTGVLGASILCASDCATDCTADCMTDRRTDRVTDAATERTTDCASHCVTDCAKATVASSIRTKTSKKRTDLMFSFSLCFYCFLARFMRSSELGESRPAIYCSSRL